MQAYTVYPFEPQARTHHTPRQHARAAGLLYFVTHVTSVVAVVAYGVGLIPAGVTLEFGLAIGCAATGVLLWHLLRAFGPARAATFAILRGVEAAVIIAGMLPMLAMHWAPACLAGALGSVDVTIGKCERAYLEAVARSHFWLSWRCRRRGGGACWGRRVARVPRSRRSGSELTPRLPRRGAICTSLAGRIARSRRSSLVPRGRRGC